MKSSIIPITASAITLAQVGGKSLNLTRLASAGFNVPSAFFIPTSAYQHYVSANDLNKKILASLDDLAGKSPQEIEALSRSIRKLFAPQKISATLKAELNSAWQDLGAGPVAVRSSATAEDLPGMSFAGQQDTFLNITTEKALYQALADCWSSLWTARAIQYRQRNAIPHDQVALSVVVQNMVQAQSSGVIFTANPLTSLRSEMVIDATLGYGEALVSGQVEPDHFVVQSDPFKIVSRSLGAKDLVMQAAKAGGIQELKDDHSKQAAISDAKIQELLTVAAGIAKLYDFPQDIEWAFTPATADGPSRLFILQSRPITSLFPTPSGFSPDPLHLFFSFGAIQGVKGPITPLGRDTIRLIFAGGASLFGLTHSIDNQPALHAAGERLWVDFTNLIRHPLGAKVISRVIGALEPGSSQAMHALLQDPNLAAGSGRIRLSSLRRILRFALPMIARIVKIIIRPQGQALRVKAAYNIHLNEWHAPFDPEDPDYANLEHALKNLHGISQGFVYAIPEIFSAAIAGLIPMAILSRNSTKLSGSNQLLLELSRGLPNNVTTEMDLALWQTSIQIKQNPDALPLFQNTSADQLAARFLAGQLPAQAQQALEHFIERYGMRGPAEIDLGQPRWREAPAAIIQTLQSYLSIADDELVPDKVFKRGEKSAEVALHKLEALARATFAGRLKAQLIHALALRFRELAGLRESPKFFMIQRMGQIRAQLLAAGEHLVSNGTLLQVDDLFYLRYRELQALARSEDRDWQALLNERKDKQQSEALRAQIPRLLLSDGRAFYEGISSADSAEGELKGSPVSPGLVEGRVRIVADPHSANLIAGEILVCHGTDPAWTPLFLAAGGLIMEVGGMMTHGAIVAREYGIPAIVGVDRATQHLATGDLIRLDGSSGLIQRIASQ